MDLMVLAQSNIDAAFRIGVAKLRGNVLALTNKMICVAWEFD
jgi:hypothetical protein